MFPLRDRRSVVRLPQASQVVSAELVVTQAARRRPRRRVMRASELRSDGFSRWRWGARPL